MRKSVFPDYLFVDKRDIPDPFGYGEEAVQFIKALKHGNSTAPGNAFELHDFSENLIRWTYGPCHPNRDRIAKTVFLMVGRGARKTSLCAALALLHTIGPEARRNGEVYFAAYNRTQAGIGFKQAADIVRMDPRLRRATKIYNAHNSAKMIKCPSLGTELKTLTSDGSAAQGLTPAFALLDEIHEWKNRALYDAIEEGLGKTSNTLKFIATTAGAGRETVAFDTYDYACKVARGDVHDPSFLSVIFQAEPGDDWEDESTWHKANPGLKYGFPDIEHLRIRAHQAKHSPGALASFKRFRLNVWQSHSTSPLFDMTTYDAGHIPFDDDIVADLPAYVGVDMSVNGDLTAVVTAWRHDDGRVFVRPEFFVPGDDLQARAERDGVPYVQWRDAGLIHAIDGPVIEPEAVEDAIREIAATYDVREIGFDPAKAHRVMMHLMDDGLPVIEMRQGILTMGPATGDLERTVNGFKIRHNAHPILRHHFDSVVASRNDTGLTRMHKGKRTDRIDGAVAAAIAVSRAIANDSQPSFLELDEDAFDQFGREAA